MEIIEVINEERIFIDNEITSKEDALRKISSFLKEKDNLPMTEDEIYELVMEREGIMSTGIGKGVAIAHCNAKKVSNIKNIHGALGIFKKGIDYNSPIDDIPVKIIFLIVASNKIYRKYLSLIANICRIFKKEENIEKILNCSSSSEIYEILKKLSE